MKWKRCPLAIHSPSKILPEPPGVPMGLRMEMKPGAGSAFCPLSLLGTLCGDSEEHTVQAVSPTEAAV